MSGRRRVIIVSWSVLAVFLSVLLCWIYFDLSYFEPDTVSYLFQAKLFARGRLSFPAPPAYGFSSSPHINILNGKWYSKYPFGNALMLTPGVWIHAPWLIPALMTGLALWLLHLVVNRMYGSKVALIAVFLGLISPATLGMGATWFSEPVSRVALALFMIGLLGMLSEHPNSRMSILSGFALGYAFNTRPVPAVAFGLGGGIFALCWMIRLPRKKVILKPLLFFALSFLIMIGLTMAWNTYFTGNPLKFTHNAAQPYDKIGFGKRSEGYEPDIDKGFLFTPKWAVERIWRHTLPSVMFNALGWGYYRPNLFRSFHPLALVLVFPTVLMLIPFVRKRWNRYDLLLVGIFLMNLIIYSFFYFEGSTWGFTPVNSRYYTECTLLAIIPLIARGIVILWERLQPIKHRLPTLSSALIAVIICALLANTINSYVSFAKPFRNWSPVYQRLPKMVKERGLKHAVVFIPHSRGAPIGDYPFDPLDKANIVYFKLGPSTTWKLTESDWRKVYDRYFAGREAYIFESGELKKLEP